MKKVLTIAGSDSSGGAGIQADLKTFSALGAFGMSVITAVTAQNTQGVFAVQDITNDVIAKQIDAIFEDIEVDALKIGMVSNVDTIKVIAEKLHKYKPALIVLDPVMVSKSGYHLIENDAKKALIKELMPLATVTTPNILEAEVLSNISISNLDDMKKASKIIYDLGPKNVLIKSSNINGEAIDVLFDGNDFKYFKSSRINTKNTHGTGCTLSSAITTYLSKGMSVYDAVSLGKKYITTAIENSLTIGKGVGPTNHFYTLYKKAGFLNE